MSLRINVPSPPDEPEGLNFYLDDAFQDIVSTMDEVVDGLNEVLHVPPAKPQIAQEVYADGVDWNPGNGEGKYVYKSTGWTFIA